MLYVVFYLYVVFVCCVLHVCCVTCVLCCVLCCMCVVCVICACLLCVCVVCVCCGCVWCVCVLWDFFPSLPISRLLPKREDPPVMTGQPPVPSHATSHLGVVHVPEQAVGLRVQNEVPPQKLAAVLILLDVQKPTDSVLPIHIRHSWALLTSPCMAGGWKGEAVRRRAKRVPRSG